MMLSRAAARSALGARVATIAKSSSFPHRALPVVWARGMAKDNKPPRFSRPQNPPSQKAAYSPADSQTPNSAPKKPSEESSSPDVNEARERDNAPQESEPIPDLSKLPDLTQGIPSTFEYEQAQRGARTAVEPAEEEEPAPSGGGGRAKGELPASAYVSSTDRRRQKMFLYLCIAMGLSAVGGTAYLGRDWDDEELAKHPDVPNGWGLGLWWNRASARLGETVTYYQDPAFEKLLPDPDPSFARPYTLCISLEDMLVHSEWSREHGWRVAKRPGVDYFLHYLSQYYEIVLFTSVPLAIADPVLRKLDPYHFIMWPLGREATKYRDGEIVKDLSYLNRDLSKVIIIDTHPQHVRAQPENAIILPKWTGDPKDTKLVSLVPFLEFIHTMDYSDVRKVIKSFEGTDIPTEFARREAIARAEHKKRLEAIRGKSSAKPSGGGMNWLSSLLGLKPSNMSLMVQPEGEENPHDALASGKMLQDIARERGIRNYLMMEEEIRKNGAQWLKEEQETQEKMTKEAMKNMQSSFTSWFKSSESADKPSADKPSDSTKST
ncbi:mitochondrial import inner membrane translocase [Echria macrotheca]|uniref:Mitochondrial import inner membrane translocase subunit TIM50 n=1 Tax=Echria macrotheca TaxID=438768 RepID=A0AAJ0BBC1_9PEZI|nr:mitochondrial import inner membrane translocase [Echria macrotheca]